MALRDILLHVRRVEGPSIATDAAVELARRFDAHLTALHCSTIAPAAFTAPEAVALQMLEANRDYDDALAHRADWMRQFTERGVRGEFLLAQGDPAEALCHASRWMDLIVIERSSANPEAPVG